MAHIFVPKITQATIKRDGIDVIVVIGNQKAWSLPWDAALELARAITIQARRIEEEVKALSIIQDQALLIRSGAPFGLSNHPDIIAEAKKEAVHNPQLRKYLKGDRARGIGKPIVGAPVIISHSKGD